MAGERFIAVVRANTLMQAEMVKGLLEGEGILARIPGELATDHFTTAKETLGGIVVEVPEERATDARVLIRSAAEDGRELQQWLAENPGAIPEDGGTV